jgi:hypothetical protein
MSVPLILRANSLGWSHYMETVGAGVTQAYTLSAIMDLRQRRRDTDGDTAHTIQIMDAGPWLIGDQGEGHWFLGDRIGSTNKYLGARVFVNRCQKLQLGWGRDTPVGWQATLGEVRADKDAVGKLVSMVSGVMADLQTIGALG